MSLRLVSSKVSLILDLISLFYSTMADLTVYQIAEVIQIVDEANDYDYIPLGEALEADVDRQMGAPHGDDRRLPELLHLTLLL